MDIGSYAYKQMSHHPSLFDSHFADAKLEERTTLLGSDRQRLMDISTYNLSCIQRNNQKLYSSNW